MKKGRKRKDKQLRKWTRAAAGVLAAMVFAVPCTGLAGDEAYHAPGSPSAVYAEAGEDGRQYLRGLHILDKETVSEICGPTFVSVPRRAEISAADGTSLAADTPAATGQVLRVFLGGRELQQYTVVVSGDVLGTGRLSLGQLRTMSYGLLHGFSGAAQTMAADMNADGRTNMTDLVTAARLWLREKEQRPVPEVSPVPQESTQAAAVPAASADTDAVQRARATVRMVNETRKEAGRSPLKMNEDMNRAAQVRVQEILAADKFSHERPDGRSCQTVFEGPELKGENLAWVSGYEDSEAVQAVMRALRGSEDHLENMCLDCYTQMGAAYAKRADGAWYACHLFANSGTVVRVDTAAIREMPSKGETVRLCAAADDKQHEAE